MSVKGQWHRKHDQKKYMSNPFWDKKPLTDKEKQDKLNKETNEKGKDTCNKQ